MTNQFTALQQTTILPPRPDTMTVPFDVIHQEEAGSNPFSSLNRTSCSGDSSSSDDINYGIDSESDEVSTPDTVSHGFGFHNGIPRGFEIQLNLPFDVFQTSSQFCTNFRTSPLYINYIYAAALGAPLVLKKEFIWQGNDQMCGGKLRRQQQYDNEKDIYVVHPTQWKYLDKHLQMVILIWIRGKGDDGKQRFTWSQVEASTGVSQKTLYLFLKDFAGEFPLWFNYNHPVSPPSRNAVIRNSYRLRNGLPNRHSEWIRYKGKPERQLLIKQEVDKGNTHINDWCAIFDVSQTTTQLNTITTFKAYLENKLRCSYGLKDKI